MATPIKKFSAFCPECDSRVVFNKKPELGQQVTCRECDEVLEVVDLNPLELDWAYDEDEDEDWDDWEDDDGDDL